LWGSLIQDNLFVDLIIACDGGLNLVGETNQPQQMPKFGSVQGLQSNDFNNCNNENQ
jgi:hypothetical protein